MGIVLNRPHKINLKDVLKDMNISQISSNAYIPIFNGGPVSIDKGFLLHNSDINSLYLKNYFNERLLDCITLTSH